MLGRILLVCLCLGVYCAGAPLGCRWITGHKFRQHSHTYLELIANMAHNSTNSTEGAEGEDTVAFPNDLHNQASKASAEDKLGFAVQILNETAALFEEDHSAASWDESTEENFLMALTEQADKLRSCMGSHGHKKNKKLHMYFKRLSSHVLKKMHHSAEAWEQVRKAIELHLMKADQLVLPLRRTN